MGSVFGHEEQPETELHPPLYTNDNQPHKSKNTTDDLDQPGCCGIKKKQAHQQSEVWRADFESCCIKLKQYFKWADIIKKAGVQKIGIRTDNMKDFNQLKYQFSRKVQNKEVPNSIEMKKLLNCSPLLEENVGDDGRSNSVSLFSSFNMSMKSSMQNLNKFKGRPQHLMVSVFDENMKALFTPKKKENVAVSKQIDQQIQSSIYLFVKFTQLLQKHSQQPNNAICKIRLSFINYIRDTYGSHQKLSQKQDQDLTGSIRAFIDLYTITINVYYRVQTLSQNQKTRYVFSVENVKSAATVILFKFDNFYQLVFGLYARSDKTDTELLKSVIAQKKLLKPQDLKINHEYCCNQLTLNWHIKKASLQRNGLENIDIPVQKQGEPFETCILKLKQIQEGQTPISKLKVVISTAQKITTSISRFYEINGITSTQLVDSDQVLTIFIYIIINSGLTNLKTHLRFIQNFCTEQQLLCETGYYSKVAQSALKLLVGEGDDFD